MIRNGLFAVAVILISMCLVHCARNGGPPSAIQSYAQKTPVKRTVTWVSSAKPASGGSLRIARTTSDGTTSRIAYLTDSPHNDYKPVISPDGTKIAFFRSYSEGNDFFLWKSSICVMNADGSGFRELTDHQYMNTEPYWTRDGSNRITWSRMIHSSEGKYGTYVYRTAWDAKPGDERQISATNWEWGNSSLKDGRMFVSRGKAHHLMKPDPSGKPAYREIRYPDTYHYLHKATISNDETRIAYMKKIVTNGDDYRGSQIVLADFDASVPAIANEVVVSPLDPSKFTWYVSISPDNQYLLYAQNGRIMMYDVETRTNSRISTMNTVEYRYPCIEGAVK